ncbi:unnamed protein product [Ectocarpus sp. 12 AP-2014]
MCRFDSKLLSSIETPRKKLCMRSPVLLHVFELSPPSSPTYIICLAPQPGFSVSLHKVRATNSLHIPTTSSNPLPPYEPDVAVWPSQEKVLRSDLGRIVHTLTSTPNTNSAENWRTTRNLNLGGCAAPMTICKSFTVTSRVNRIPHHPLPPSLHWSKFSYEPRPFRPCIVDMVAPSGVFL